MRIAGLQKLTLLDYPGEVACTVFTQGCNLCCPFCQNPDLVLPELFPAPIPEEEFFDFLKRRRGRLTGVAITGGEPTLQPDLPEFLGKIREMGFLVKLDTNGLKPDVLRRILADSLVDYVAMDVKNSPGKYDLTCGCPLDGKPKGPMDASAKTPDIVTNQGGAEDAKGLWEKAEESIDLLMEGPVAYEFRTTVALGLHTTEDIREMARHLSGARAWYLQQFVAGDNLIASFSETPIALASPSAEDLEKMREAARELVPAVSLRGV